MTYKSLVHIAKLFDVSTSYIKKHFSNEFKEGVHFVYVGKLKRFNVNEMQKLLTSNTKETQAENKLLERFLI